MDSVVAIGSPRDIEFVNSCASALLWMKQQQDVVFKLPVKRARLSTERMVAADEKVSDATLDRGSGRIHGEIGVEAKKHHSVSICALYKQEEMLPWLWHEYVVAMSNASRKRAEKLLIRVEGTLADICALYKMEGNEERFNFWKEQEARMRHALAYSQTAEFGFKSY